MADFLIPLISAAAGLGGALGGVALGGALTNSRERKKQRTDRIERKLSEFYGPLMTLYKQIEARRGHRGNIEEAIVKALGRMPSGAIDNQELAQAITSELDAL